MQVQDDMQQDAIACAAQAESPTRFVLHTMKQARTCDRTSHLSPWPWRGRLQV